MEKVALLTECTHYNPSKNYNEQLISVGGNSGNNAYISALKDLFNAEHVNYGQLDRILSDNQINSFVVGNLSWIQENTPLPGFYIDAFRKITSKGKRFVPISVGTQVYDYKTDFNYHPETIKFLQEISDQAVIACRGNYTAELLYSNGVKNVEVVGCPSLYHKKNPKFNINKPSNFPVNKKIATGITPWPNKTCSLNMIKNYFKLLFELEVDFVEQANTNWIDFISKGDPEFENLLKDYLEKKSKIFFDINEWRDYSRTLGFTFGARFHGNVIPLLEGIPSLFISIDARTKEMCEFFEFPTIDIKDFDFHTSLETIYNLIDYSKFNVGYSQKYNKIESYLKKNNLQIHY